MDSIDDTHPMPLDVPRDRRTLKKSAASRVKSDQPAHFQRWTDTMPAPDLALTTPPTAARPARRRLRRIVVMGFFVIAVYSLVRFFRH